MSKVILQGPEPRPRVSAMPGTAGYANQVQALIAWQKRNPPTDPVSKPFDGAIPEGVKASDYLGTLD